MHESSQFTVTPGSHDIIEREWARLTQIFRQAPSFLCAYIGPDYVFELANEAFYRLVGDREVIGKPLLEALPEIATQGFIDILDNVTATCSPFVGRELSVFLQRTPGAPPEERFVDFVYQPMLDAEGICIGVVTHGHDVTEQVVARREVERLLAESERSHRELQTAYAKLEEQQTELLVTHEQLQEGASEYEAQTEALDSVNAELRASETRFRDVFEQAPVAVAVMTGPDHVYTIVSPRYQETTGGGRPLLGRSVREAFPELVGQGFPAILDRVYDTGIPFFAAERRVWIDRDSDGVPEEYFFNIGYQPLRDALGHVYAVASVAVEVTGQIRARQELEVAREAAESASRAKSEFLTTMSHELRTPLNAIAGYADLLLLGVRGPLNDAQSEDITRMRRSGQYLLSLINDILNFAKLGAGQIEYHVEPVPVSALLADLEALATPQIQSHKLAYTCDPCDGSLVVRADGEKARQILLNLVTNATKFTNPGGTITVWTTATTSDVSIHVRDTGRGIAPEQQTRIFDPFVQIDRHLTPASQQGVGLGLAISRDLARNMNGDLTVESELGVGSTFTVTLPRVMP